MTSQKVASPTDLSDPKPQTRQSLREARARAKPSGRRAEHKPKLVLASASPRRLALLDQVGVVPDALRPVSIDETPRKGEMPRAYANRVALEKATAARDQLEDHEELADSYILAADTVVASGRRILIKPEFVDQATETLRLLSGRSHKVFTSVALIAPDDRVRKRLIETRVRFRKLSSEEIDSYIASREWRGKAGGYAIQGIAGAFVQRIVGSYSNVVGLPLHDVVNMLVAEDFPIYFNWLRHSEHAAD